MGDDGGVQRQATIIDDVLLFICHAVRNVPSERINFNFVSHMIAHCIILLLKGEVTVFKKDQDSMLCLSCATRHFPGIQRQLFKLWVFLVVG